MDRGPVVDEVMVVGRWRRRGVMCVVSRGEQHEKGEGRRGWWWAVRACKCKCVLMVSSAVCVSSVFLVCI